MNQGYRRFPVFLEIAKSSYDLYASMSLTGGSIRNIKGWQGLKQAWQT